MSIIVRTSFPYSNKFFDKNDSEEQQLTDYIMHTFLFKSNFTISGSWSLEIANNVANTLNNSNIFTSIVTVSEHIDIEPNPETGIDETETYRRIAVTST